MLRQLEVFQTADGNRFDVEAKAIEHTLDAARDLLDRRLKPLLASGKLTASDTFKIVMALIPDKASARELSDELALWFNYGDEE